MKKVIIWVLSSIVGLSILFLGKDYIWYFISAAHLPLSETDDAFVWSILGVGLVGFSLINFLFAIDTDKLKNKDEPVILHFSELRLETESKQQLFERKNAKVS
jgi:hypothetical protein